MPYNRDILMVDLFPVYVIVKSYIKRPPHVRIEVHQGGALRRRRSVEAIHLGSEAGNSIKYVVSSNDRV